MLNVVVFRTSNTFAQAHIVAEGFWISFCGESVPAGIREVWDDPRNPYRNKSDAGCTECIAEWRNGRTGGGRDVPGEQTEGQGISG